MASFFSKTEFPYIITLFIGLIGYQLNIIVSDINDSPIVEYDFIQSNKTVSGDSITIKYTCLIHNISKNHTFKDLNFLFRYENNVSTIFKDIKYNVISPSSIRGVELKNNNKAIYFKIMEFHPNQKYEIEFVTYRRQNLPSIPKIYVESENTIQLLNSSTYTFIARNFFLINLFLCAMWIFVIIILTIKNKSYENK